MGYFEGAEVVATKYYFVHNNTGRKFEIVARNKEAGTITLKGAIAEFEEPFDADKFKKQGYTLTKEEVPDDAE